MKRTIRRHQVLVAMLLAAVAAWPLGQAAQAGPSEPEVPPAIGVEQGHKLFLVAHAVGVQIYRCAATSTGFEWTFVAPRADLFDARGKLLGTHFAGPTWRARDGSSVRAARVDGVVVDPTAIPWLLLRTTETATGDGGDRLAATTFIQRLATVGGVAPAADECNESTAGDMSEVPYTADYTFWKATGGGRS